MTFFILSSREDSSHTSILYQLSHHPQHRFWPKSNRVAEKSDKHGCICSCSLDDAFDKREIGILGVGKDGRHERSGQERQRDATQDLIVCEERWSLACPFIGPFQNGKTVSIASDVEYGSLVGGLSGPRKRVVSHGCTYMISTSRPSTPTGPQGGRTGQG